jgi:O-antigen/teichoic acid export membrane protein
MTSNLLLVAVLGRIMGRGLLAEYLLVRRIVGWMQSSFVVCSALALPYYISRETSDNEAVEYFWAALITDGLLVSVLAIILLSQKSFSSYWLFGDRHLNELILPVAAWSVGYAFHGTTFGYHRGRLEMNAANLLQIFNLAAFPFLTFGILAHSRSIVAMLAWSGALMVAFSIVYGFPRRVAIGSIKLAGIVHKARKLLRYGIPRIPSQFGFMSLTALGPIIASHYLPLSEVTYLLLGGTLFTAFSLSVMPLSVILLSKVSRMLSQDRGTEVGERLQLMLTAIFHLTVFATVLGLVFADVGLRVWLGPAFAGGGLTVRILLLGVPFYVFINAMGSTIDAASVKAHNARNMTISLACFLLLVATAVAGAPRHYLSEGIACAWSATLAIFAFLTSRSARLLLGLRIPWPAALPGLYCAVALGVAGFLLRFFRHFQAGLPECLGAIALLSAAYVSLLHASGASWLRECRLMLFCDGQPS